MNQSTRPIVWLAAIFAALALCVAGYTAYNKFTVKSTVTILNPQNSPVDAASPRYKGDFKTALAIRRDAISNPTLSKEKKAVVEILTTASEFHETGNVDDRIKDTNILKDIVVDKDISLETRVAALNAIGSAYDDSGRDPKVFDALYKGNPGEPWGSYLVPNDPDQSSRNLYQWSYSMSPTAYAAIRIADWYALQWIYNRNLNADTQKQYVGKAIEFMNDADQLATKEMKETPNYELGNRNAIYRTWKVDTVFALSVQPGGEAYKSQYRKVADSFVDYVKTIKNSIAVDNLFYVRADYAAVLNKDNDAAGAKVQLEALAQELNALPNPDTFGYVRYVRNILRFQSSGPTANRIRTLSALSPSYDAAIKKVIATAPAPSVASSTISDGR